MSNPFSLIPPNPQSLIPNPYPYPCYACLYQPPILDQPASQANTLIQIAREFSPRYERHRDDLVSIDIRGLERFLGPPRVIAHELRREAADRGVRVRVAVAGTRMAALVLALARPGITVVDPGDEPAALAAIPISILEKASAAMPADVSVQLEAHGGGLVFKAWGIRTLGELAALPSADLAARLGQQGLAWQVIARGEDSGPLVPDVPDERFESSIDLEWPIDGIEPLSFVLTRLLEPLVTRLERCDRAAAVLHIWLHLVTREAHARRLELPSPLRDVRTLRTLALIDLESHPSPAAIDRVTVVIDPTPGRVLQHTLFTRVHSTPDAVSTLLARLGALMGQDRIGRPSIVETYRPGAFEMKPFATERSPQPSALSPQLFLASALRRCRQPVPARVVVDHGRPVRVTTDRHGVAGGVVVACAGPWRTSGNWWSACRPVLDMPEASGSAAFAPPALRRATPELAGEWNERRRGAPRESNKSASEKKMTGGPPATSEGESLPSSPRSNEAVQGSACGSSERERASEASGGGAPRALENGPSASGMGVPSSLRFGEPRRSSLVNGTSGGGGPHANKEWNRDEWDVALTDGSVYRVFQDRETDGWFIDAIID